MAATNPVSNMVRCLLIPLRNTEMLVPSSAIAEISPYEEPMPAPLAPEWLLGMMMWRGLSIPLLSVDKMMGVDVIGHKRTNKIAVFNTLNGSPSVPFFAVETQGIPRLFQVTEGSLELEETEQSSSGPVLCQVNIEGNHVVIPDLDLLENTLIQQGMRLR